MSHFDGQATLVPGALRVYRTWAWDGSTLLAVNWPDVAWGGHHTAICLGDLWGKPAHASPDEWCQCGVYGWYDPADTAQRINAVFGVVEVSGRVVLGDRGVRAQHARVVAITEAGVHNLPALHAWCMREGVTYVPDPRDLVEAYPPEDIRSLLPTQRVPRRATVPAWVMERRRACGGQQVTGPRSLTGALQVFLGEICEGVYTMLRRAAGYGAGVHR